MKVVVTIDGPSHKTLQEIEANAPNIRQAIRQTFFRMGRDLKDKINRDILKGVKSGRVYWIKSRSSGKRRRHKSSAPGETHANMFGDLRRSLGWKVVGTNYMEVGYGVTRETTPYARRIEEGGTDSRGITIEARPSIGNNTKDVKFETFFQEAVNDLASK